MLRKETVYSETLELLNDLMRDQELERFFLVGGTALSLQIGHRMSIDLDLFSLEPFDKSVLLESLESKYRFQVNYQANNTLKGQIGNIAVDLISHIYPLLQPLQVTEGVRLASMADIAAMKLNAIINNGSRLKDFIDVAFLSSHLSLNEMVKAYSGKYDSRNPIMAIKALAYHNDIDFDEPVLMIGGDFPWKEIDQRLSAMINSPKEVFNELQPEQSATNKRGRGR